jgi:transketolase
MSTSSSPMYSKEAHSVAKMLGLTLGRPNLVEFAETLQQLAEKDANILAVTSDSRGSGKLVPFGQALPKQIIEMGIAEQNLVGVAAGLSSVNKHVFAVSPACFLTARSLEQIKNDVAYSDNPVTLVGISAGVSYGALGSTHHSLHDLAVLRAINNLEVIVPADNFEAQASVRYAASANAPIYLRFGKAPLYHLPRDDKQAWKPTQARSLREGKDACFIATGETVIHAFLAAAKLTAHGIECGVISVPSIKPIDTDAILQCAANCGAIVTVEEHMVNGGLGEACASVLAQSAFKPKFKIVGIPDEYTVTGSQADIFRHYGISMEGLSDTMLKLIG